MNDAPQTPRELLLARHAGLTPRLDALRRAALPAPPRSWRDFFGELFLPHRTAWRILAATWVALVIFHLTLAHPPTTRPQSSLPPAAVAAWLTRLNSYEAFAQIDRHP